MVGDEPEAEGQAGQDPRQRSAPRGPRSPVLCWQDAVVALPFPLVDVTDARAAFERAESDRINAVFDYHKAFAALESAVGRPLR